MKQFYIGKKSILTIATGVAVLLLATSVNAKPCDVGKKFDNYDQCAQYYQKVELGCLNQQIVVPATCERQYRENVGVCQAKCNGN